MSKERIEVTTPGCREKFETWIRDRGGVAVWRNINLSNPNAGKMFTPAMTLPAHCTNFETGESGPKAVPYPKPHWSVELQEVVIDISRFRFCVMEPEAARLRIAIRMGSQGLSTKLTDASTRRLRKVLDVVEEKFGRTPCYHWEEDFGKREAVVTVPVFEDDEVGWFEAKQKEMKGGRRKKA